MTPKQYPIQGAGTRDQTVAVRRRDDQLDQFVDHGVFYPHQVAAAFLIRHRGAPEITLFVAGGQ